MSRFVHVEYSTVHGGVERFERAAETISEAVRTFDGARGLATLLLAAIVAALAVVANELVETWTDGHLLAAWVALWAVAFATIGLFASPLRRASRSLRTRLRAFSARRQQDADDRRLWDSALTDARVMADLARTMNVDAARDLKFYS